MTEPKEEGRISTGRAARLCGLSSKTLLKLARDGKVPGAAELVTGLWRFDAAKLRDWLRRQEAQCQRGIEAATISTRGAGLGTPEFRLADATSDEAYERLFAPKRSRGSR
jgi:phage terminase Nu1 subunit (DNA packaging protein)